jgi:hypothetical protein
MWKIVECSRCGKSIKIEGETATGSERPLKFTCLFCDQTNELAWPSEGSYIIKPAQN